MRTFPEKYILILLLIYWILSLGAWSTLYLLSRNQGKQTVRFLAVAYFIAGLIVSGMIIHLYTSAAIAQIRYSYSVYFWFNAFLIVDLFCKFPLALASWIKYFFRSVKSRLTICWIAIVLSAGTGLSLAYGMSQGTTTYIKQEIILKVNNLPLAFDGFRILQVSDIHLGSFSQQKMIRSMSEDSRKFDPDLVVFTGDLVNNYSSEAVRSSDIFKNFSARNGKYAVLGNHDYGDYSKWSSPALKANNLKEIEDAYRASGFRILRNESERIIKHSDTIALVGVDNWGHPPFHQYADLQLAADDIPDSLFCILLSHDPSCWESKVRYDKKFGLTLSGHTHGLQWGIVLAGIRISPIQPLYMQWGGCYEYQGRYLYVNRGLGIIGMNLRIDMPAEITLITLRRN
jgi:uncharacterized protein